MDKRKISLNKIEPRLREAAGIFIRAGKQVYLVGGAVRDILRGKAAHDWDLATSARPEEVTALFRSVIPTGIRHGTVTVRYKGLSMEVTTFRTESSYSDGRRPDRVEYAATIEEDLSRRDFTMNAAAVELSGGRLIDPFDGAEDIDRRIIRCVGNASERFTEDGLRPLRALRFAAQLGFEVEEETLSAIPGALETTAKVASERVRDELDKIIASEKPSRAFVLMEKTGLLRLLLPELAVCRGVEQGELHRFDVLDHSLAACDFAAEKGFPQAVRLAALFHDIGKERTRTIDERGILAFHRHEAQGAAMVENIMKRLRYPGDITASVSRLVKEHMFHYDETWSDAAVRRFIIRVGEENLENLFALRRSDAAAMTGKEPSASLLLPLSERIRRVLSQSRALSIKDLAVSGNDLMEVGVRPGKYMGIILKELLETVLDDPAENTREKLLEIAGNLQKRYASGDPASAVSDS